MAPVKFQGKDGQTLSVGDMVWAKSGREAVYGCVTGFDFEDDQLDSVELTIHEGGRGITGRRADYSIENIFETEQQAYHQVIRDLNIQRTSLGNDLQRLDDITTELLHQWGLPDKETE